MEEAAKQCTDVKEHSTTTETLSSEQRRPVDYNEPDSGGHGKGGVSLTFSVASSVTSTWEHPSLAARRLMSDTMIAATGHCLKDSTAEVAKCQLEHLTSSVMQRLSLVKAPEDNRIDDYADTREKMVTVGTLLTEAMESSKGVKRNLKKQRRLLASLERETQALESYLSNTASSRFEILSTAKIDDLDKETFVENMMSLITDGTRM
ncbi:hypothetical protein EMCRGX_G023816 [Ephydatia muelleri]|eukprot:Em0015g63a